MSKKKRDKNRRPKTETKKPTTPPPVPQSSRFVTGGLLALLALIVGVVLAVLESVKETLLTQ